MKIKRSKAGGLSLVQAHIPSAHTFTLALAFPAGSRAENPAEAGIAHFLEHMVFKGGQEYKDYESVQDAFDRAGLMHNAFTSWDTVCYFSTGGPKAIGEAISVWSDIVARPALRDADISKEKGVVREEMRQAKDQASYQAYDLAVHSLWPDTCVDRSVLGTPSTLRDINRADLLRFKRRRYMGGVLALVGNLRYLDEDFLRERAKLFRDGQAGGQKTPEVEVGTFFRKHNSEQTHLVLSWPVQTGLSYREEVALLLLVDVFSKKLWVQMREELGLCYTIRAADHITPYESCMQVYTSLKGSDLPLAAEKMLQEFELLSEVSDNDIEMSRATLLTSEALKLDSTEDTAFSLVNDYIVFDRKDNPEKEKEQLEKIRPAEVRSLLKKISSKPGVAVVGPERPKGLSSLV